MPVVTANVRERMLQQMTLQPMVLQSLMRLVDREKYDIPVEAVEGTRIQAERIVAQSQYATSQVKRLGSCNEHRISFFIWCNEWRLLDCPLPFAVANLEVTLAENYTRQLRNPYYLHLDGVLTTGCKTFI